jgi:hypothetical protein
MARGGLEPPTPRFSGTAEPAGKGHKSPANREVAGRTHCAAIPVVSRRCSRLKDVAGRPRPFRLIHETPRADCCLGRRASVGSAPTRTAPCRPERHCRACRSGRPLRHGSSRACSNGPRRTRPGSHRLRPLNPHKRDRSSSLAWCPRQLSTDSEMHRGACTAAGAWHTPSATCAGWLMSRGASRECGSPRRPALRRE